MFNIIINIINIIIFIINKFFKNIINIEKNYKFNLNDDNNNNNNNNNNNMLDPSFFNGKGARPKKLGSWSGCHAHPQVSWVLHLSLVGIATLK
jgi:sortase (surface protein transpeptidase)